MKPITFRGCVTGAVVLICSLVFSGAAHAAGGLTPSTATFKVPTTESECQYLKAIDQPCVNLATVSGPVLKNRSTGEELALSVTAPGAAESPAESPCLLKASCNGGSFAGPGHACGTNWYTTGPAWFEVRDVTGGTLWHERTEWNYHGVMCQSLNWDAEYCSNAGLGFSVDTTACGTRLNDGGGEPYYYTSSRTDFKVSAAFRGSPISYSHYMTLAVDPYGNGSFNYG